MAAHRYKPDTDHTRYVRNCSSRNGAQPKLITIHSTEGANLPGLVDLKGLGNWFDNPAAQASSHIGIDQEANSARFVRDADKAWTQAYYNPWCLSIENVGQANQTKWSDLLYKENARWIAYWCHYHGIRCYKGSVSSNGQILKSGVIRHSDLGNLGGGHHDPGSSFDLGRVMEMARKYLRKY